MDPREKPARRALDVPLHARDLPREIKRGIAFHRKRGVQNIGRLQIRVTVHNAITFIFGVFQRGNQTEYTFLFAEFQVGLATDKPVACSRGVLLPQLKNGERSPSAPVRKPDRLERAVTQGLLSAGSHHFDGHTAFKYFPFFKAVKSYLFRREKLRYEGVIFIFRHGAVDIITRTFAVSVARKRAGKIDAVRRDDGRGRIVKMQHSAQLPLDVLIQTALGKRTRSDDSRLGQNGFFAADDLDILARLYFLRNISGKLDSVHRERAARGNARLVRRLDDKRTQTPHFLLQQSARIAPDIVALQRIGADEFGERCRIVRGRKFYGFHFHEFDGNAPPA